MLDIICDYSWRDLRIVNKVNKLVVYRQLLYEAYVVLHSTISPFH